MTDRKGDMERIGRKVLACGYDIIPIKLNDKERAEKGWRTTNATPKRIIRWGKYGIGIRTDDAPVFDLIV